MAPFVENYANRYRVRYTTGRYIHTNLWHYGPEPLSPPADMLIGLAEFYDSLATRLCNSWSILSAEFAVAGSDVFLPADAPELLTARSGGTIILPREANQISFRAKSGDGRSSKIFIFGSIYTPEASVEAYDFRATVVEDPIVAGALGVLGADLDTFLSGIDGTALHWYQDVLLKQNDAMVKKIRGG